MPAPASPPNPANWKISAQAAAGGDILLRVQPGGALENDPTDFIPDQPFVKSVSSGGSIKRDGKAWLIHLKRATKDALKQPIPQGNSFSGILIGVRPIAIPDTAIATVAASASPPPAPLPLAGLLPDPRRHAVRRPDPQPDALRVPGASA